MKNVKLLTFGLVIIFIFFFLRIYNLTLLPVFVDEAIYLRWSQVMRAEPTLRFLPLSDGKQPLFMWLTIPFLKIFSDPLFAGRLLSVLAGFLGLLGLFLIVLRLIEVPQVAFLSALFYTLVPYFLFFDRMSLVDSLLSALGIWVFYLGVWLMKEPRLDLAMITGMVLGAALITKSPAIFFAILLPTTLILSFDKIKNQRDFVKILGLLLVVYFFAFGIYNILRLGPNFHLIGQRNQDYVFTFQEVLKHPLDPFQSHLKEIWRWSGTLFTGPIFLLSLLGLILGLRKYFRPTILLLLWSAGPLLVQSEFAKVFTPRYLLFAVWPLLILAAMATANFVSYLKPSKRIFGWGVVVLLVLPSLWFDFLLLFRPEAAPLPRKMRSGYLEEWTAGQGLKEIAEFVKRKAQEREVVVATEGYFGTLPNGLQIYLEKVPQTTIFGTGQVEVHQVPDSIKNAAQDNLAYFVVNDQRMKAKDDPALKLLKKFPKARKPDGERENLLFYQVILPQ